MNMKDFEIDTRDAEAYRVAAMEHGGLEVFIDEADTFDHLHTTMQEPSPDWIYFPPKKPSKLRRLIDRFRLWLTLMDLKSGYVGGFEIQIHLTKELKNADRATKKPSKLRRLIDRFGLWLTLVDLKSRYVWRDPYDLNLNEELRHEINRLTKELKNADRN